MVVMMSVQPAMSLAFLLLSSSLLLELTRYVGIVILTGLAREATIWMFLVSILIHFGMYTKTWLRMLIFSHFLNCAIVSISHGLLHFFVSFF